MSLNLIAGTGVKNLRQLYFGGQWVRNYALIINRDWQPGKYPKTEDERRAAAKKYGLIPEDYEPYPDDGFGYGDYPKLPIISAESRDPHKAWEIDELKRDFGEPLHADADIYGEDRWDYNRRLNPPLGTQLRYFLTFVASIVGIGLFGEWINTRVNFCKRMPPHMANDGKVHYTFECV